jgi:hypothetical protein
MRLGRRHLRSRKIITRLLEHILRCKSPEREPAGQGTPPANGGSYLQQPSPREYGSTLCDSGHVLHQSGRTNLNRYPNLVKN